jgi:hypothetical protein
MSDGSQTVDNGVNVEALIGARDALTKAPGGRAIQMACSLRMEERHA